MISISEIVELVLNNGRMTQATPQLNRVLTNLTKLILFGVFAIIMLVGLMGFGFSYLYFTLTNGGLSPKAALGAIIAPIVLLLIIAALLMRTIYLEMGQNVSRVFNFQTPIGDHLNDIASNFIRGFLTPRH